MKLTKFAGLGVCMSAAIGMLGISSAQAQIFTTTGTSSGAAVDAQATFTYNSLADTLTVVLVNLETGNGMSGQALSGIIFNGLQSYSSVTGTGQEITINTDGTYSFGTDSTGDITQAAPHVNYWSYNQSANDDLTALTDTQPDYMIIAGPGGSTYSLNGNGNGFANFDPYVYESATFVFSNVTYTATTSAQFEFGTGPDATLTGTNGNGNGNGNGTPVPEASTVMAGALMLLPLGIGAIRALRKERSAARIS